MGDAENNQYSTDQERALRLPASIVVTLSSGVVMAIGGVLYTVIVSNPANSIDFINRRVYELEKNQTVQAHQISQLNKEMIECFKNAR